MERNDFTASVGTSKGLFAQMVSDFSLLVKFRLTLLVLFSAALSYFIVAGSEFSWLSLVLLTVGGFLVTGSANTLNQVLERDYDRLMQRTANRPLAAGRMSVASAVLTAGVMALLGICVLSLLNPLAGFLGTLSLISYSFIYTPMKRYSSIAVWVGAIPGALPNVIGAVAHEQQFTYFALMLFMIQFLWQFPHFWAVAWLADEDYKRAGFYLLPSSSGEKDRTVGSISALFCLALVLLSLGSWFVGLVGFTASLFLVALNLYWLAACWKLQDTCSRESARKQMFISFIHLPVTLIVLLLDRLF